MIGRFYYFPIREDKLVIDTCEDDNSSLDGYRPICIGYLYIKQRKMSYVELAARTFALLFRSDEDYVKASNTLTQVHEVYTNEEGIEMTNVYFTFNAKGIPLNIYELEVDINDYCLSEWNVDFRTRNTLLLEIERMSNNYGMS